jgi:hypothetical protein
LADELALVSLEPAHESAPVPCHAAKTRREVTNHNFHISSAPPFDSLPATLTSLPLVDALMQQEVSSTVQEALQGLRPVHLSQPPAEDSLEEEFGTLAPSKGHSHKKVSPCWQYFYDLGSSKESPEDPFTDNRTPLTKGLSKGYYGCCYCNIQDSNGKYA